ncbi:Uncharacterized protein HZ326_28653 [Fusarium oxysporum f. sp. albedinis]|nr:Uncharacterized protein HZ326_28653 [Fusarium oxysporum f. sp. albedinis]
MQETRNCTGFHHHIVASLLHTRLALPSTNAIVIPRTSEACKLSIELRYGSDYEGLAMKTRLSLWMAIAT